MGQARSVIVMNDRGASDRAYDPGAEAPRLTPGLTYLPPPPRPTPPRLTNETTIDNHMASL